LFAVLGFELRVYTWSHSTSPFFGEVFFQIGSLELFAQAGTVILLISVSRVARITGVSHWRLAGLRALHFTDSHIGCQWFMPIILST
jgi:hypothetical protein